MAHVTISKPELSCGRLVAEIRTEKKAEAIYFTTPDNFSTHPDCVASAYATLCGRDFQSIHFAFPVSAKCRQIIERVSQASVTSEGTTAQRKSGTRIGLNFSGGFDSLAAYLLAPEKQIRVAVDFKKGFERERAFFSKLAPEIVCETNLREKGYAKAAWQFMGAATFLYADYLDLAGAGYGTIFEATTYNYRLAPSKYPIDYRDALDLYDATMTRGLTEFGTALVLTSLAPELVAQSRASVAPEGSEKSYRKRLLVEAASHHRGGSAPSFSGHDVPLRRCTYGTSFALDFLALAFAGLYGMEAVSTWMDGLDIVDEDALNALRFDWLFKYNQIFEDQIPPSVRSEFFDRLTQIGIGRFDDDDFRYYTAFRSILAKHHRFPA